MCYLLQTEYVRVIAVDELNNSIEVAVVALVDPAVDVVGGDPQPLAHPPPSTTLGGQLQLRLAPPLCYEIDID